MTMTQRRTRGATVTANPSQGVRIERSTNELRQTAAGRIALPLLVAHNGARLGEGDLVMTYDDASSLYADLGRMLAHSGPSTADGAGS
ncbi:hypothetical protein ACIQGT_40435 [Streptomyces sp. NPDC093108]|uniref:hypothetical protein n=1 Tax=unclassified Streptomyces TaxID=2593676 RepID=UPI003825E2E7